MLLKVLIQKHGMSICSDRFCELQEHFKFLSYSFYISCAIYFAMYLIFSVAIVNIIFSFIISSN